MWRKLPIIFCHCLVDGIVKKPLPPQPQLFVAALREHEQEERLLHPPEAVAALPRVVRCQPEHALAVARGGEGWQECVV